MMQITLESPDHPEVIALIAQLDAYQSALYPPESTHLLELDALKQAHVLFAVARDGAGSAIGCGAMVLTPDYGELKRMYVSPHSRGQGVASRMLQLLEVEASVRGTALLTLETGTLQPEALRLYERFGYTRRGPFGAYRDDPLSVFMQKRLSSPPRMP